MPDAIRIAEPHREPRTQGAPAAGASAVQATLRPASCGRRGALLLLVLMALTFFMMIGTLMLITATRTRTTSRAFADATSASAAGSIQARGILDEALLLLLRGRRDETNVPAQMKGQSILEDMYGPATVTGQATAPVRLTQGLQLFTNYAPILTTTLTNLSPAPTHCCDLNGRVLTFKPAPGDGDVASFRILRTTKSVNTLTVYLANMPLSRSVVLPKQASSVVINGREFCPAQATDNNEGYDAFDKDPWLARLQVQASKVTAVPQASFAPAANAPAQCDNDNDGVPDGVWISGTTGFFPDRPSPLGGMLRHELSFHVVDLDSRINLNAHGSLTPVITGSADWPATFNTPSDSVVTMSGIPPGLGFGPADVSASRIVATGAAGAIPGFPGRWSNICLAGTAAQQQQPSNSQRRPTPLLGQGTAAVDGRYGADAGGKRVPGRADSVVAPLMQASLGGSMTIGGVTRVIGNSPTDLNSRIRMFNGPSTAGVPTLYFFTPDCGTYTSAYLANDFRESPYELRLDVDGPRGQEIRRPSAKANAPTADDPFTLAELERVLRQFDPDAGTLPPRLAAILDDFAERSRLTVTTDSWDTPAMAGDAMTRVRDSMRQFAEPAVPVDSLARGNKAANVYEAHSTDVSAGLRFDINRPLDHPAVNANLLPAIKERYCRHLYMLLVALGQPPNQQTAQWAANVCDFRDPDSTMTRFRYDTNPSDGWDVDDNVDVLGAERPEVVITETVAYPGNLAVVLYHPWDAKVVDKYTPGDSNKNVPVETVDPQLADTPNVLDLRKKNTNDSVWRLRVVGGVTVNLSDLTAGGAANKCKLKPNEYLCVQTTTGNTNVGNTVPASTLVPVAPGAGEVVLERLADPSKKWDNTKAGNEANYNPYVIVDRATIQVGANASTYVRQRRKSATFWKQAWEGAGATPTDTYKSPAPWFHWPNRPFVSVAELALVPTGDASGMLAVGAAGSPAANPASLILEACHVPSRFAGTGLRIGDDSLLATTASYESVCTTVMPRWREPGRVNVNTIASNTGNGQGELDNAVWQAVVGAGAGGTIATSPFATGNPGTAADSFTKMLSLQAAAGNPPYTQTPAAPRDLNPFFQYATAIRLANVATIRSNVFAVWITLRITDTSASAPPPIYRRVFAIIDRSIPVGFSKGETLNVRDTIRLQRFLD